MQSGQRRPSKPGNVQRPRRLEARVHGAGGAGGLAGRYTQTLQGPGLHLVGDEE